ncbi:MAG: 5-formyltetrahydrofolate cyclo-ligase [Meiothermus sp.]|uniref:5-formyltetrahydrofolate cyclo-ligase n=1 Tax=Meiothermus sp. TaxID=1955249 RepID=UPI0025F8D838|nr:5-formyltetrahydrofolate cyclo-ligase [Meiothermus sp.]MCS7067485.1 5-formyltetrahydrofolate cyclo-ligase [Meiothermus sp.]MDW8425805.1 5-formyltetrahydrofolate cyclo-ligase [Meiothermus sp.]
MNKAERRSWAKGVRKELPTALLSARVVQHLAGFLASQKARHILLYSAFGSELDPAGLQTLYPACYYLPRARTYALEVHPLPCRLVKHKYGFWEPAPESPRVEPAVLDAVLVPGLAFDPWGHRLGYGQGFYDRFLAQLPPHTLTIGLVAEALLVPELPHDPWDVPVRFLATEQGVRPALQAL